MEKVVNAETDWDRLHKLQKQQNEGKQKIFGKQMFSCCLLLPTVQGQFNLETNAACLVRRDFLCVCVCVAGAV